MATSEMLLVQAETPGFFPVMEVDGRWGVVRAENRKIVRSGIATEQEARELAGSDSIRVEVQELCERAIHSVTERAVLTFENRPHIEDFEIGNLVALIRGYIERHLEADLPKWAGEISERVKGTGDLAKDVVARSRARAQEKERDETRIKQPAPERT